MDGLLRSKSRLDQYFEAQDRAKRARERGSAPEPGERWRRIRTGQKVIVERLEERHGSVQIFFRPAPGQKGRASNTWLRFFLQGFEKEN